jgi:UV DNA damage endonuclease
MLFILRPCRARLLDFRYRFAYTSLSTRRRYTQAVLPAQMAKRRRETSGAENPVTKRASRIDIKKENSVNPNKNSEVIDGRQARQASPEGQDIDSDSSLSELDGLNEDIEHTGERLMGKALKDATKSVENLVKIEANGSEKQPKTKRGRAAKAGKAELDALNISPKKSKAKKIKKEDGEDFEDPEAGDLEEEDIDEVQKALNRPPAVNSDFIPIPWKGRLGYVCHLLAVMRSWS